MEWLKNNYDKYLHLLVGAMLTPWLINDIGLGGGWLGWCVIFAIAFVYKELIHDKIMKKGTFEKLDVVYTMIIPTFGLIINQI